MDSQTSIVASATTAAWYGVHGFQCSNLDTSIYTVLDSIVAHVPHTVDVAVRYTVILRYTTFRLRLSYLVSGFDKESKDKTNNHCSSKTSGVTDTPSDTYITSMPLNA